MPVTRKAWAKNLRIALGLPPLELHASIARLSVLYEDLRIELAAAAEPSLPALDYNSDSYRRNYFMRRAMATLLEMDGALRVLNGNDDFEKIRDLWSATYRKEWHAAITAFEKRHEELKAIRNAIGGHFSHKAALYAIQNVHQDTVGLLVLDMVNGKLRSRLEFAGDYAATAHGKDKGDLPFKEHVEHMLEMLVELFGHATNSMHILTVYYIASRFGAPTLKE